MKAMTTMSTRTAVTGGTVLLAAAAATTLGLGLNDRADAASQYAMRSTQQVYVEPSTDATVMGKVAAAEKVSLHCYDTDRSGRLFAYIEYKVDAAPGTVKRGFVDDAYLRTGRDGRLPGVPYRNCPPPLTTPGAPIEPAAAPTSAPAPTCWERGVEGNMDNKAGHHLFNGRLTVRWCADRVGDAITTVDVLDNRTQLLNSTLVHDPRHEHELTMGSVVGRDSKVQMAVQWSAAKSAHITADLGAVLGGVFKRGPAEGSASANGSVGLDLEPGRWGISALLTLTSTGGFEVGDR